MAGDSDDDARRSDLAKRTGRSSRQRGDESRGGIYAPPRQRGAAYGGASDDQKGPGIFSRITGRHRIDDIRRERLQPYQYESNEQSLRWTAVTMAVWCCVMAYLAFTDWQNGQRYSEWVSTGITTIPPATALEAQVEPARFAALRDGGEAMQCAYLAGRDTSSICPEGELPIEQVGAFIEENDYVCFRQDDASDACAAVWTSRAMVEFARIEGFDCPDGRAVFNTVAGTEAAHLGCERVFSIGEEFRESQDRSQLIWLFVVLAGFVVAFPYLSTVHRASRNLLTLRSRAQKHRPEWAVLHHFIPFFNFVMPGLVMRELFRGSDPSVGQEDEEEWKRTGRSHSIAWLWHLLWVLGILMNPIILPRLVGAANLPDLVRNNNLLLVGDLLLVALGVVGVLMLLQLHRWQQERHALVGMITVTPPQPIDPLQEAMDRRDAERTDSDNDDKR